MKDVLKLDGLEMTVLDGYLIFLLVYVESENEYLILRNDASREYTIMYNFKNDLEAAKQEFDNIRCL